MIFFNKSPKAIFSFYVSQTFIEYVNCCCLQDSIEGSLNFQYIHSRSKCWHTYLLVVYPPVFACSPICLLPCAQIELENAIHCEIRYEQNENHTHQSISTSRAHRLPHTCLLTWLIFQYRFQSLSAPCSLLVVFRIEGSQLHLKIWAECRKVSHCRCFCMQYCTVRSPSLSESF